MASQRYAGGQDSSAVLVDERVERTGSTGTQRTSQAGARPRRGAHRLPPPPAALRGRVAVAAVAIGALAAAGTGQSLLPKLPHLSQTSVDGPRDVAAVVEADPSGADNPQSLEVQPAARTVAAADVAAQLAESQRVTNQAGGETFARPASGTVVASFGGEYGTFHYGIEIQNKQDSPVYAAADGVIIAAGPVSGFGLWVKEQLSDGTILVYARLDDYSVQVNQRVTAGQQIARMGDQGFSRGQPTLHFEVWDPSGKKIDPQQWLSSRGVTL